MSLLRLILASLLVFELASCGVAANPYRHWRMGRRAYRMPYVANRPVNPAVVANESSLLQQAYGLLSKANRDYDGHRAKAMQSVHAAAKALGMNLTGNVTQGNVAQVSAKKNGPQVDSDSQLKLAQGVLQQVHTSLTSRRQQRVSMHVNAALQHIATALAKK